MYLDSSLTESYGNALYLYTEESLEGGGGAGVGMDSFFLEKKNCFVLNKYQYCLNREDILCAQTYTLNKR